MLAHCKLMECQNGMAAIHPRHNKLILALRTAMENGEGSLVALSPCGPVGPLASTISGNTSQNI
jgi:hypothetical protein